MSPSNSRNFWIGVVSKEHVDIGVAGGFAQVNHGKAGPLERMRAGDGFAFYSPRTAYPDGELLQAFTAIGRISNGTVYQVTVSDSYALASSETASSVSNGATNATRSGLPDRASSLRVGMTLIGRPTDRDLQGGSR
jgi:hypothetical protein